MEKKIDKGKENAKTLAPEKKDDKSKGKKIMNLINHDQTEKSLTENSTCYALVAREVKPETEMQISGHIKLIHEEFFEVLPKDLPGKLLL